MFQFQQSQFPFTKTFKTTLFFWKLICPHLTAKIATQTVFSLFWFAWPHRFLVSRQTDICTISTCTVDSEI